MLIKIILIVTIFDWVFTPLSQTPMISSWHKWTHLILTTATSLGSIFIFVYGWGNWDTGCSEGSVVTKADRRRCIRRQLLSTGCHWGSRTWLMTSLTMELFKVVILRPHPGILVQSACTLPGFCESPRWFWASAVLPASPWFPIADLGVSFLLVDSYLLVEMGG